MEGTVREKLSRTSNYAWVIFIGVCMCSMSFMVMGVMIFGVYLVPLAESTGAGLVAASLYMTIFGWVMAVAAVIYGWLYAKATDHARFRLLNIIVVLLFAASPMWNGTVAPMFGIYGYYIGAGLAGLSGGCFMALVPLMMITNWFGPRYRGKFMGIASAASIIGSLIWPPLFTWILQNIGMDLTYVVNSLALLVFSGIPAIFLFRKRDDDVLPWGVKSWDELREQEGGDITKFGFPPGKIFKSVVFYLFVLCTLCFTLHGSMAQNLVGATTEWLSYDPAINGAMVGAFGMSVAAVGEACWKILSGIVIDKIGPAWNNAIFTGVAVIGLLIWVFGPKTIPTIYIGGAFFGAATVPIILGGPMLMSAIFGPRTFPIVQGYNAAVNTFFSGLMSPVFAMLILNLGYTGALGIGAVVWIIPIVSACLIAVFFLGKMPWFDEDGNPLPKAGRAATEDAAA
jgi:MFS family permease